MLEVERKYGPFDKPFELPESWAYLSTETQHNWYYDGLASNMSLRLRGVLGNSGCTLFIKVGDDPINGAVRSELALPLQLPMQFMEQHLLDNGLKLQSKWRRLRLTFSKGDLLACVDYSAYGHVLELEGPSLEAIDAEAKLLGIADKVFEGEALQKAYEHYLTNWQELYRGPL